MGFDINFALQISKWPPFSKRLPKWLPKSINSINELFSNLFGHKVHQVHVCCHHKVRIYNYKIQNGPHQNPENDMFSFQYI